MVLMAKTSPTKTKSATWGQRFWAWLIDIIILGVAGAALFPFASIGSSVVFFLYWTLLEYYKGQSIGKIALNIKVVNMKGKNPTITQSAISSFGKTFLLPIDMIIGLLALKNENLRIFNKLSDTRVVKAD